MKRFTKTCGSILLAASLVLGTFGIVPAAAAESATMDPAEFATLYEDVKTATKAVESATPTKTDANVVLDLGALVGKSEFSTSIVLDPSSHNAKMTVTSSGTTSDSYIDRTKKCMYYFNPNNDRYEVIGASGSISSGSSILDGLDITKLAPVATITKGKGAKVGDVACQDISVQIKAEGDALAAIIKDASGVFGGLLGNPVVTSGLSSGGSMGFDLSKLNPAKMIKDLDLTVTFYVDETKILRKTELSGTISLDVASLLGFDKETIFPLKVTSSTESSVVNEAVVIPKEFVSKAQLAAGYAVKTAGVTISSILKGTKTVFSVTGVTKTKATKLTIPASSKQFGKSYKISQAETGAFKKAKKLKTLIIKNATLKKAVKKNPTAYGLKKNVKIK